MPSLTHLETNEGVGCQKKLTFLTKRAIFFVQFSYVKYNCSLNSKCAYLGQRIKFSSDNTYEVVP